MSSTYITYLNIDFQYGRQMHQLRDSCSTKTKKCGWFVLEILYQ